MSIHLTTTSSGAYSVGVTLDAPTSSWVQSETSPCESIVAPTAWVDAWVAAYGAPSDHQDGQWYEAVRAWSRWVQDDRVVEAIGPDEAARGELQAILWTELGITGQDASVIIEETIHAICRRRSRLGVYAPPVAVSS